MIVFKQNQEHERNIDEIQKQLFDNQGVLALSQGKTPSNTLRNGEYKHHARKIDLSPLNGLLFIDRENLIAAVEPKMTIQELCHITLKYGLIPAVVPEFTSITVGGAVMGAALESSSHRYGQFNDTCLEYELLLGNGERIHATKEINSDLFFALPGSYGSLAILLSVKLRLHPAKKFVTLNIHSFDHVEKAFDFLNHSFEKPLFLDGVALHPEWALVIEGNLSDSTFSQPLYTQNRFSDLWFYDRLTRIKQKNAVVKVTMPMEDYLFRLDQGAFWMGRFLSVSIMIQILLKYRLHTLPSKLKKIAAKLNAESVPSPFFQMIFKNNLTSKNLYKLWHSIPSQLSEKLFFIHDFYVPLENAKAAFNLFFQKTEITPVWLCPLRGTKEPQFLSPHYGTARFINMGFYGIPKTDQSIPYLSMEMEKDVLKFKGRKMLYSYTYYSKELFSQIYHQQRYDQLRKKYSAEAVFLPLYNKVVNMVE